MNMKMVDSVNHEFIACIVGRRMKIQKSMRFYRALVLLVLSGWLTVGWCDDDMLSLKFGVYQSDKATVMYRKFTPVLEFIQTKMEYRLSREVDISLRIFKSYDEAADAIISGAVDVVRFGPISYVQAKLRNPNIGLVVKEERNGKPLNYGVIIVPRDSSVRALHQLKGKSFAFGDKSSTFGRHMPQAALVKAGLRISDFAKIQYLGRHDKVFKVVALGKFDGGAIKETTIDRYNRNQTVRVIHRYYTVGKPWICRDGLEATVVAGLRAALLALKDPDMLRELKVSGFLPVTDQEYAPIVEVLTNSSNFGG